MLIDHKVTIGNQSLSMMIQQNCRQHSDSTSASSYVTNKTIYVSMSTILFGLYGWVSNQTTYNIENRKIWDNKRVWRGRKAEINICHIEQFYSVLKTTTHQLITRITKFREQEKRISCHVKKITRSSILSIFNHRPGFLQPYSWFVQIKLCILKKNWSESKQIQEKDKLNLTWKINQSVLKLFVLWVHIVQVKIRENRFHRNTESKDSSQFQENQTSANSIHVKNSRNKVYYLLSLTQLSLLLYEKEQYLDFKK